MNKSNKVISLFTIIMLICSLFSINQASAATNEDPVLEEFIQETEIISSEELKDVIKQINESSDVEKLSLDEKAEIFESIDESVSEEIKEEYHSDMKQEIQNEIENIDTEKINDTGYIEEEITLSDGSKFIYEASDFPEEAFNESDDEEIIPQKSSVWNGMEYSPERYENKEYGSRRYSCIVSIKSAGVVVGKLYLKNHYSVGDYGLKMRYTSDAGTMGVGLVDILYSNTETTDGVAPKINHDINGYGVYRVKMGYGWLSGTFTFEIVSQIKLLSLDKNKKTARVYQGYSVDY